MRYILRRSCDFVAYVVLVKAPLIDRFPNLYNWLFVRFIFQASRHAGRPSKKVERL